MITLKSAIAEESISCERFDSDSILVDRTLAGDPLAFESLFQLYHGKVFAIAHSVLLDKDEAEDAVQEIFALVFRNLSKFDRRSKFSTWLFRLAVNRSIQESRKSKRRRVSLDLDVILEQPAHVPEVSPICGQVEEALAKIPPADRAILAMFYWEEFSLSEIAQSLGCRENAAKTRLYRARERFRSCYIEEGEDV